MLYAHNDTSDDRWHKNYGEKAEQIGRHTACKLNQISEQHRRSSYLRPTDQSSKFDGTQDPIY